MYILGGSSNGYGKKFEGWNATSNTSKAWTKIPNMPYKAERCTAAVKDKIYIME